MNAQIDALNQALADQSAAIAALKTRVDALQAPDLSAAIAAVQANTQALSQLAQPAATPATTTTPPPAGA